MRKLIFTFSLLLGALTARAQCDPRDFDPILELQITTGMNGIVLAQCPDITVATLSGLVLSNDTIYALDISPTNEIQRLDTFQIVSNTLRASLLNDGVPYSSVSLAAYLDNTDSQVVDTFAIVSNVLRLSLSGDNQPFKFVSLAAYLDNTDAQNLSLAGQALGISGGTGVTLPVIEVNAGTGITVSQSSGIWTVNNIGDLSAANEGILGVGSGGSTSFTLVSNTTGANPVTVNVSGILSVTESASSNGGTVNLSAVEGDASPTNEAQTLSTSGASNPTVSLSSVSGSGGGSVQFAAGTNVTVTYSAGVITISSTGGGGVTAANNGLTLSSSTVQLGGTLIQNTAIDQNSFLMRWYDGQRSFQRSNTNNPTNRATVDIDGEAEAITKSSTPIEDAIVNIHGYNTSTFAQIDNQLSIGVYPTGGGIWLQGRSLTDYTVSRYLAIQPNGGQVVFGNDAGSASQYTMYASLAVPDGTLSKSTLHLRNANTTNGGALITYGVGGGTVYDGVVGYFLQADAMRIANVNTTGTPSVRIAVGSETTDVVTVTGTGAGFGTSTVGDILSTVQIEGSLALQTSSPSGDLTLTGSHCIVTKVAGSNCTYTLPTASAVTDRIYEIYNHTNATITLSTSVTKGNGSTFNTVGPAEYARIISVTGNGWRGYKNTSL